MLDELSAERSEDSRLPSWGRLNRNRWRKGESVGDEGLMVLMGNFRARRRGQRDLKLNRLGATARHRGATDSGFCSKESRASNAFAGLVIQNRVALIRSDGLRKK